MLTRSFIHMPGIGQLTEQKLWEAGIRSWEDALARAPDIPLGQSLAKQVFGNIETSLEALENRDWMYFYRGLPSREHWRMLNVSPARIAYLDIETTGLSAHYHDITCIGIYDGTQTHSYVRGQNLEQFAEDIGQYDLLVTYNGKTFDVPFIRTQMGLELDVPHVDLRYVCASVGFKGGLKGTEKLAGIKRDQRLEGVDGFIAVKLWKEYQKTGNHRALETLVAYNLEDVINLAPLSQVAWNRKLPSVFSSLRTKVVRARPKLPCQPDWELVRRLVGDMHAGG